MTATRAFEPGGYSADLMRQARLLLLTERPADALVTLERAGESTEVHYWRARTLEKLGQTGAAVDLYRSVAATGDQPELAERAKQDLAFLEWKIDIAARKDGKSAK
jgi:hypothetical protein